jgi:hypothetical protein
MIRGHCESLQMLDHIMLANNSRDQADQAIDATGREQQAKFFSLHAP